MQSHPTSETALAAVPIALGFGKLMDLLVHAEPALASISYIVGAIAGIITIYYKIKRRS